MASKPFTDTFLPSLLGGLSEVGPAMVQGMIGAEQLQRDRELHQAQMANQRSLEALRLKQAVFYGQPKQTPELQALMALQSGLSANPDFLDTAEGRMYALFGKHSPVPRNMGGGMMFNPMNGEIIGAPKDPFYLKAAELGYDVSRPLSSQAITAVQEALQADKARQAGMNRAAQLEAEGNSPVTLMRNNDAQSVYADTGVNPLKGFPTQKQIAAQQDKKLSQKKELAYAQGYGSTLGRETVQTNQEITELENAKERIKSLGDMARQLFTEESPAMATLHGATLKLGASTGLNQVAKLYEATRQSEAELVGRQMLTMRGVFTDRDIPRVLNAMPTWGDTAAVREYKLRKLDLMLDAMIDAKRRGISGDQPNPALRKRFEQLFPDLQQELKAPTKKESPLLQSSPLYQQQGQAVPKPDLYAGLDKIMTNTSMKPEEVFSSTEYSKLPSGKQSQLESFYKRFASGEIDKAALSHAVHGILDEAWGNVRAELAARVLAGGQP